MICKFTFKRIFALILSTVLIFNCVGFQAFATDSQIIVFDETLSNLEEPLSLTEAEVSGAAFSFFGIMPEISEEREIKWFDRIHNKPEYVVDFYDWLVENETPTGALVTGHEQIVTDANKKEHDVHKVTTFSDPIVHTFPNGFTMDDIRAVASEVIEDNFYTAAEWITETFAAFDRDHPEAFWLSGKINIAYKSVLNSAKYLSSDTLEISYKEEIYFYLSDADFDIRSKVYASTADLKNVISQVNAKINSIVAGNTATDVYGKIKYINKYLTENNCYNKYANSSELSPMSHQSVSALLSKNEIFAPVCDGYAKAFKVLCDKMGIPCVLVDGLSDTGAHMWNNVQLNGEWYAVDPTWNDPVTSSTTKKSGKENEKYLLVGRESVIDGVKFADSHIIKNTVIDGGFSFLNGPIVSNKSYNTTVSHFCSLKNGFCTYCYSKQYDTNRDTYITIIDLVYLKKTLLDDDKNGNLDCDADGIVNSIDFVALKKYLWENF